MDNQEKNKQDHNSPEEGPSVAEAMEGKKVEVVENNLAKPVKTEVGNQNKSGNIVIGTLNVFTQPLIDRHKKHYKESTFHLIADVVLGLIIVGLVISLVWAIKYTPKSDIEMLTEIEPNTVLSGRLMTITLNYVNNGSAKLNDSELAIRPSENFEIISVMPESNYNPTSNTVFIGDLAPGANGKIKIKGYPIVTIGTAEKINFSLSYQSDAGAGNALSSLSFPVEGSALVVETIIPREIFSSMDFNGEIRIKNTGERDIKNIQVFLPEQFELRDIGCSSACQTVNKMAVLEKIEAGSSATIQFTAIADELPGEVEIKLPVFIKRGDENLKQFEKSYNLRVINPSLLASLVSSKEIVGNSEKFEFSFGYENQGEETIKEIELSLKPSNANFILEDLDIITSDEYELSGNMIIVKKLLAPGREGSLSGRVKMERLRPGINQTVSLSANVKYTSGDKKSQYIVSTRPMKALSDLKVSATGRYYSEEGDQLGIGPIPPLVNIPTNYWIFFGIANTGNMISGLKVQADLPANVIYTGEKSLLAGRLDYGTASRRVVWTIDEVEEEEENYRAGFEVQVLPTYDDVGTIMELAKNINYSGQDEFCKTSLIGQLDIVDTNLKDDKLSAGKGKVLVSE